MLSERGNSRSKNEIDFSANLPRTGVSADADHSLEPEVRHATHERPTLRRTAIFFETMSKRRRGYPSETHVKRGMRVVNGGKLLEEKLGRNDLCPCGSGKRFKSCCLSKGCL